MISSLEELNEVVNNVVNYIVSESTQKTTTGNWIINPGVSVLTVSGTV